MRGRWCALVIVVGGACGDREPAPVQAEAEPAVLAPPPEQGGPLVTPAEVARVIAEHRSDDWYAFHMQGHKIGWAHVTMRPTEADEPGAYRVAMEMHAQLDVGEVFDEDFAQYYAATPPHAVVELTTREAQLTTTTERRFVFGRGGALMLAVLDGVPAWPRWLPPSADTLAAALASTALPDSVTAGQAAVVSAFDSDLGRDQRTTVEVIGVAPEVIAGVSVPVVTARLLQEDDEQAMTARFAGGKALEITLGPGSRLELTDRATAQDAIEGLTMNASAVAIDHDLGDLAGAKQLTMLVEAPAGFVIPSGPQQEVTELEPGRHRVVTRPVPGLEVTDAERARALEATLAIDRDAPPIAELAARLTRDVRSDRARVDRIVDWVYRSLEKTLSTNLGTASHVLARREGDCTEHTLLVVALARAAGIPARPVDGLMYAPGTSRFYWHAWTQVALDGRWVAVDGAWGQHVADPGHLMLGVGDSNNSVGAMGAIRIAVPAEAP